MTKHGDSRVTNLSRRDFIARTAATAGAIGAASGMHAAASETLRIAMVGCGDRGTRDAVVFLQSTKGVELYAMADMFQDRLDGSLAELRKNVNDKVNVTKERMFLGFDAYKKVLALPEVDIVMYLTPPGFRPEHVGETVKAGKHMFLEKPGAVDPVGIRALLAAAAEADKKRLSIVVGTQQRYAPQYLDIIDLIWNGRIGDIRVLKAHWICDMVDWHYSPRQPSWSDMEWQIRCWPFFTWLSGDHLVEQLCHNIDVCNWVAKAVPASCTGLGGRQCRIDPGHGHIYDHFAVEYRYPNGLTMIALAAQMFGVTNDVSNRIEGTKGIAHVTRGGAHIEGERPWRYQGQPSSGEGEMYNALVEAIRQDKPINECPRLAEATMTAIAGRMATYTGRAVDHNWALKESKLDLRPAKYELGPIAVPPVAMPGKTPLE